MKKGKLSQAALDRLVLRPLKKSKTAGPDALYGMDSARVLPSVILNNHYSGMDQLYSDTAAHEIGGRFDLPVRMVYLQAVNSLAASGAQAVSASQTLMIPENSTEEEIRTIAEEACGAAAELGIVLTGGSTSVSDALSRPVLSVTVCGIRNDTRAAAPAESELFSAAGRNTPEEASGQSSDRTDRTSGLSIVMAGTAGLGGTAVLAAAAQDELCRRYPSSLVDDAISLSGRLNVARECLEAWKMHCTALHDISEGGVFGALWELAGREQAGFDVDLKKIPIRQETVEICEYFDLNPYQLFGQGAFLALTPDADELCTILAGQGQYCAVIGHTAAQKARCIHNGEEVRYLEKPQQDMLWTVKDHRKFCENEAMPKE